MTARAGCFVGVDVVDLDDARCVDKHHDPRFLARILTDTERERLSAARDDAVALWRMWAAKEAAYKVISKVTGTPPPFVHAAFEVSAPTGASEFGTVSWQDRDVHVHWHSLPGRVGAVAWNGLAADEPLAWGWGAQADLDPEPDATYDALLERLTPRERRPVHSRGSALVRLVARAALASALDVEVARVQVVCSEGPRGRVPPEVLLDDDPAPVDVSLSHHGRWLAWALRRATPKGR